MLDLEGIGNNIKRLRIENNLSQEELASKLFLSRQAISLWEKGNGFPSIDNVVFLSKLFNITIEKLLLLDESFISLDEYFLLHSKNYIISEILNNNYKYDLISNLYRFNKEEIFLFIKSIIENRIKNIDINRLKDNLSIDEKVYINRLLNEKVNIKRRNK